MTSYIPLASLPARVRTAWRAHLAAAGQRPGLRAHLLRQQAVLLPRFAAAYAQLQALPRPQRRRLFRRLKQSLASLALLLALGQAPALADIIPVDGTTCTLVDAITAANTDTASGGCPAGSGADTLELPPNSVHTLTTINNGDYYTGYNGLPEITSAITIAGSNSTIQRASSAPAFRIFLVAPGGELTLQETTVSGGYHDISRPGGAIYNTGGSVTIEHSTLSGNSAAFNSGGVRNSSGGTVSIAHSTLSGNSGRFGGGVENNGTVTITHSTLSGNSVGGLGGGVLNYGAMTLTNSTLTGNSARRGGGVANRSDSTLTVTIEHSTLSGNSATTTGGGVNNNYGTVTLARTLVSGNTAPTGPEIFNRPDSPYASSILIADNHNLFGHDGAAGVDGFTPGPTDVVPTVPLSAILDTTLANNGGSTQTLALVPDSPAIDASPDDADCPATDQRGVDRPQGVACDIGAVEADVVAATTLCSTLGDDRSPSLLDQDIFRFTGVKGETVTLTLSELLSGQNTGERATLILLADIRRVLFVRTDNSALPSTMAATLPATGRYLLTVAEQPQWAPGTPFRGDYCVTLESSGEAWQTLVPTDWVEGLIE